MNASELSFAKRRKLSDRLTIFSAILYGCALGCFSASILCAIDAFINALQSPISALEPKLDQLAIAEIAIVTIFFAPALETLIFHVPVFEMIGFESRTRLRKAVIVSALLFSCAHYIYGGFEHASRMIVLGGILSLGYAWARRTSLPAAFCLILSAHTMHNAILVLLLFSS